jgi:hypothetical protein
MFAKVVLDCHFSNLSILISFFQQFPSYQQISSNVPSNNYNYNDISMMYIDEDDRIYLVCTHGSFTAGMRPFQPITKRTQSRVVKLRTKLSAMQLSLLDVLSSLFHYMFLRPLIRFSEAPALGQDLVAGWICQSMQFWFQVYQRFVDTIRC